MIKISGLVPALIAVLCVSAITRSAEQLYQSQPSVTPELANPGIYSVGVTTMDLINPGQLDANDFESRYYRAITLEVWYPAQLDEALKAAVYKNVSRSHQEFAIQGNSYRDAPALYDQGKFPLVVLSHGYTGYRTMMFYLAEHLASHGYIVAAIDHTDSTNADVDAINSPNSGFLSTLLNRSRDQQFVLDYFSHTGQGLREITDSGQAAVIGFSMGGFGAINTVGACYSFSEEFILGLGFKDQQLDQVLPIFNSCHGGLEQLDSRWKAMVAIAPWGGEFGLHSTESMSGISVASLYIAGDQDDISGFENGVKKLFQQTGSENKYLLVYENARHNIAAHPAPGVTFHNELDLGHYYEPSWDTKAINRINMHMILAFLDCHIKVDAAKCDFLPTREDITQIKQANGDLTPPWPGFPGRWGTGVKFYRGH